MLSFIHLPNYYRARSNIWVTRSPLLCFKVVEWHLPDRFYRQFGFRQDVPMEYITSARLHAIDMRGRRDTDWTKVHGEFMQRWEHRHDHLVVGVPEAVDMRYDDSYMVWYRRITRPLVGNPTHRLATGCLERLRLVMP